MLAVGSVCARCLGLYVGVGVGALIVRPRLRAPWLEVWLALTVLAMLADVASEALGWRPAWAPLRLATGLALGYTAGVNAIVALREWASRSALAAGDRAHGAQNP